MPDFSPWVVEGIRAGGWALVPFLCMAITWLVGQVKEYKATLDERDAAHMRTIEGLVPLIREIGPSMGAIGRRLEALDILVREQAAEARAARGRR